MNRPSKLGTGAALLLALLQAACVAPKAPPPKAPAAAPPVVALPAPDAGRDWPDATPTAGTWIWSRTPDGSRAVYGPAGQPVFVVQCAADRTVMLYRPAAPAADRITLTTSFGARTLAAGAVGGGTGVRLAARDALLDQLVFTRGRFMVEGAGVRLILPSWAEYARVIEDCRG